MTFNTSKYFFIRHAECKSDPEELTAFGKVQAKYLSIMLEKQDITQILFSSSQRSSQTAQVFRKKAPSISYTEWPDLREIYRVLVGGPPRPGTHSTREADDRVRAEAVIERIFSQEGNIAIFCHGNFIRYVLAKCLHKNPSSMWPISIDFASITIIERSTDGLLVRDIAGTSHLNSFRKEAQPESYLEN